MVPKVAVTQLDNVVLSMVVAQLLLSKPRYFLMEVVPEEVLIMEESETLVLNMKLSKLMFHVIRLEQYRRADHLEAMTLPLMAVIVN